MIAMALHFLYSVGVGFHLSHLVEVSGDDNPPLWIALLGGLSVMLWPLWQAGRLLQAPVQYLLPPPADDV